MAGFSEHFIDFLYDWADVTGLLDTNADFDHNNFKIDIFLEQPEAIAALMAIYDDVTVSPETSGSVATVPGIKSDDGLDERSQPQKHRVDDVCGQHGHAWLCVDQPRQRA